MNTKQTIEEIARELNGKDIISKRGVPYINVPFGGDTMSICYMGKKKVWRTFYPAYSDDQVKIDFADIEGIKRFIRNYTHNDEVQKKVNEAYENGRKMGRYDALDEIRVLVQEKQGLKLPFPREQYLSNLKEEEE